MSAEINALLEMLNRQNEERRLLTEKLMEKQKRGNTPLCTLPSRFQKKSFNNFIVTEGNKTAYEACKELAEKFEETEQGVLIYGPNGTGKTHLAAATANAVAEKGYTIAFGNMMSFLSVIKSSYSNQSGFTEYDIVSLISLSDLTVLDDIDMLIDSGFSQMMVYHLVNHAYENEKKMIVTTKMDLTGLFKKLGEATASRLVEMCQLIPIKGQNQRLKKLTKENNGTRIPQS